jgi:hypothetical protein
MSANSNNKIAAVGAALAAGAAVAGAAVESLPVLVVAAGVGIVATSIKLVEHHRREQEQEQDRMHTPVARASSR